MTLQMAIAAGNAESGRKLYADLCVGCHGDTATAPEVGPSLKGVYGRKAGTEPKGVHSSALMDSKLTWNDANLRKFLTDPVKLLPGTYMPVGFPDAQHVEDLIAFLRTLR